ncbi:hypothetical protein [Bradyrhizobium sp.]|uniref:hypothetical protein n=1 Tax=Bradyrhizobium sp. TaxID=376 RepID=UPI003C647437
MIERLCNGFEGKLTSSKWATLARTSRDTALRDLEDLVSKGILGKDAAGGRSTSYSLVEADIGSSCGISIKTERPVGFSIIDMPASDLWRSTTSWCYAAITRRTRDLPSRVLDLLAARIESVQTE